MTDSAGEKTAYTYDSLNRLKKVKDGLGTIEYTYDANGNITEVRETENAFQEVTGGGKTIHREFDSLNRVKKYVDYKGREVSYGYDTLGNLVALTYPGGEIVSYEYYDDGSVRSMTSKSGGTIYTWEYTYDQYGRLKTIDRPDGSEEERTYDEAGNLLKQVDMLGNTVLSENTYTYNVFGEVISKSTASGADLSRLTTVEMTYNAANRLETYNGQKVIYDEKGNMTYGPVDGTMQELTYDCRNRLTEAGGVTYTYDAENTRIAATKDGRTTEYVTSTGGSMSQLLTAYEADGTETRYYYGAEGLAGQYNTGTKQYLGYHYDNIGSTTMVTDITGKIVEQFAYGTYGELLTTVKNKIRFLYNGSYGVTTDENGLYYMRARYYNPDIKRFINQDIKVGDIGSSQSLNSYAYCEGNPVSLVDPFGLSPESTQDQGKTSKYEKLHNLLGTIGIFFDGADLINGFVYLAEKDYVNAAISFACGIPAVGTVVTAVAKTAKLVKYATKAAKIAKTCRDIGRIGNAAAGMKALYDTYQTAERECETTGEKIAYIAGTVITGYLVGKAANKGAEALKKFASKAIPKLKTALRENAGKLVSKVSGAFSSFGSKSGSNAIDNRLVNNTFFNNGERIATTRQIRNYKKQMNGLGIKVVVDKKGKVLNGNKAAGFDYSTGTIYIKKKAGVIDLYHEGYHVEQYLSIGQENYINLGMLTREEYVYSRIMENSSLFNEAELQGATNYIMKLRGGN